MSKQIESRNGSLIAVLRPDDPAMALQSARRVIAMPHATANERELQAKAFNDMLNLQPYTFVGLLARSKVGKLKKYLDLCDYSGKHLGATKHGDSMLNHAQLQATTGHTAKIGVRFNGVKVPDEAAKQ